MRSNTHGRNVKKLIVWVELSTVPPVDSDNYATAVRNTNIYLSSTARTH